MNVDLGFVSEVWDVLRDHLEPSDRPGAADDLVNLLIDHNVESDDIKDAFRSDRDISKALTGYAALHDGEEEDPDEYEEDTHD